MNTTTTVTESLMTTADVAEILRLSVKTIGEMIRNGELPAIRVGGVWRVRKQSLEDWLQEREMNTAASRARLHN